MLEVLEKTVQLTAKEKDYVDVNTLSEDDRYFQWRDGVNGDWIPSVEAVKEHIEAEGRDYRYETAPHPIDAYRQREARKLPKKYES